MHWVVRVEGGPRRVNHSSVSYEYLIYSFGGFCTGEDNTSRPIDIHVFNTVTYQWTRFPDIGTDDPQYAEAPYMRYGHTAVRWNDRAYIWGGRNDSRGACNKLFYYDLSNNKWTKVQIKGGTPPGPRDGHCACIHRDKMYIFGGFEDDVDLFTNDIFYFDLHNENWVLCDARGNRPRWRDFHSGSAIGDVIYIFGGRGDKGGQLHTSQEIYENNIFGFDTIREEWNEISAIGWKPIGRRSHSAWVYNGELYIFGGYNALVNIHYNELFKFNPDTKTWSSVVCFGKGPSSRRRQSTCLIRDRIYLFGGTCPMIRPGSDSPLGNDDTTNFLVDQNDLYILDYAPTLKTLASLVIINNALDTSVLPKIIRLELEAMTTNSKISPVLKG